MSAVVAGLRLQGRIFRTSLGELMILLIIPFFVLMFFSITRAAGRTDLDALSLVAPALAGAWTIGLILSSDLVQGDRWQGMTELVMSTPASSTQVLLGRCLGIGLCSLIAFAETYLCAVMFFQVQLHGTHTAFLLITIVLTALAVAGTAGLLAALFQLVRTTATFQNVLGYPIYVLGGIFTPASFLPQWLHPFSRLVFLSWSSDALRWSLSGSTAPTPYGGLLAIAAEGVLAMIAGLGVERRISARLRVTGTAALS